LGASLDSALDEWLLGGPRRLDAQGGDVAGGAEAFDTITVSAVLQSPLRAGLP
jgi:hypothetical protein